MAKISVQTNCGNSPKKEFLKDYHIAAANGDVDFLSGNISENISWEIMGGTAIAGKENYLKAMQEYNLWKVKELVIDTIITHGIDASVNGEVVTTDNVKFIFCDIYKFKGFKGSTIKSIKSFLIKT